MTNGPSEAELHDMKIGLEQVQKSWLNGNMPTSDELNDLSREAASITESLKEATEAWGELPDEDDLSRRVSLASELVERLKEAVALAERLDELGDVTE